MKKIRNIVLVILLIVFVAAVTACACVLSQFRPLSRPGSAEEVRFEIPYGTSLYAISERLYEAGLIRNQKVFYASARYPAVLSFLYPKEHVPPVVELKSGIYRLDSSMTYARIVNLLMSGQQEYVIVSIPEGLTLTKIAALLEKNGLCAQEDFLSFCRSPEVLQKYHIPAASCEGYLFPDTYYFTSGMSVLTIGGLLLDTFFAKIKDTEGFGGLSDEQLFRVVTLASIVEREYRLPEEAPLIASVFTNRLRENIGLYSCATIEYILTEQLGRPHPDRILIEDTKIDSPYNTYKWAGLPPGPISNPGLVALSAAATPPETDYYFFQVEDARQGRHVFTTTFEEHKLGHNLYTKAAFEN